MARFGSLNRAAQKGHYNALYQVATKVVVHPPDESLFPPPRSDDGRSLRWQAHQAGRAKLPVEKS